MFKKAQTEKSRRKRVNAQMQTPSSSKMNTKRRLKSTNLSNLVSMQIPESINTSQNWKSIVTSVLAIAASYQSHL